MVRNYRKKMEYQKSLGIDPPIEEKGTCGAEEEDSGSEYSYFSEEDDDSEGEANNSDEHVRSVFTKQDLNIIHKS